MAEQKIDDDKGEEGDDQTFLHLFPLCVIAQTVKAE